MARFFTGIAIFISCLGLLGLSSFMAQQRIKEIGIRKVLGASVANLFVMLSMNYGKLLLAAFIIAAPLGFYFSNNWLQQFAYRIDIKPDIFILSGVGALIITLITISYKALKVAIANPVDSLKEE